MYQERPERGIKRVCLSCDAHFYDLMHVPPVCPKCGAEFVIPVQPPSILGRNQKWKSLGKSYPEQKPETENLETEGLPSDDDPEPEEDGDDEDELPSEDEETEE